MFNNKSKIYEDNITEDELNEYFDMYHKYETVGDIESGTYTLIIDRENFYFYKGHIVPEWLYKATADDLKIEDYRKCKNDTEKVIFIDKFGYKNFIKFGVVVDSYESYPENEMWFKSEYQLVDMSSLPMFCAEENEYYLEPKIRNLELLSILILKENQKNKSQRRHCRCSLRPQH